MPRDDRSQGTVTGVTRALRPSYSRFRERGDEGDPYGPFFRRDFVGGKIV
ncbi:hypothetical protein FBY39_3288 [Microbacterium sp. SLBN-146]|nr:hypothetical protein FBY39_3288 [Microbacterium sp. SLBN-146]